MLSVDSSALNSMWSGQTEKYIKAAFELATDMFPCVLFIDEVDSTFYRRSSRDSTHARQALTQFLSCMDGLTKSDKAPLVLAVTNRPGDLDEAFLRRLPKRIYFGLPDAQARTSLLRLFVKDGDLAGDIGFERLAALTDGYSGSDLRSVCIEAGYAYMAEQQEAMCDVQLGTSVTLRLAVRHFEKALRNCRPSVSKQAMMDLADFRRRFNPDSLVEED